MSYAKNGSGTEIIEENNFYPFGLKHEGYNAVVGNPSYNYQYNGKELQKETGWNDYGARMYMADIGRWGVIDPLAETSRRFIPYNYAYNNPISFIDPDGRKAESPDSIEGRVFNLNAPEDSFWWAYAKGSPVVAGSGDSIGAFFTQMKKALGISGGGSITVGELMNSVGVKLGTLDSFMKLNFVLNLRQELINAGWDNPESTSTKFDDWWKLVSSKGTSLNELYRITKAQFEEDPNINSPGATSWNLISINMSKNKNLLEYAFTIGHEMYGHVFANLFFKDKFSEITRIPTSSPRTFKFFQEVMGIRWEMDQGATRYGDRTALDAAEFYYGGIGHGQSMIDRVRTDYTRLTYEWNKIYNIQKNKIK